MTKLVTILGIAFISFTSTMAMANMETYCFKRSQDQTIGQVLINSKTSTIQYSQVGSGRINSLRRTSNKLIIDTYLTAVGDGFPATIIVTDRIIVLKQGNRVLDSNNRILCNN